MRRTIELSQSEIIDVIKAKYNISFAGSMKFFIDLHGDPGMVSGMPVSGTISIKAEY